MTASGWHAKLFWSSLLSFVPPDHRLFGILSRSPPLHSLARSRSRSFALDIAVHDVPFFFSPWEVRVAARPRNTRTTRTPRSRLVSPLLRNLHRRAPTTDTSTSSLGTLTLRWERERQRKERMRERLTRNERGGERKRERKRNYRHRTAMHTVLRHFSPVRSASDLPEGRA